MDKPSDFLSGLDSASRLLLTDDYAGTFRGRLISIPGNQSCASPFQTFFTLEDKNLSCDLGWNFDLLNSWLGDGLIAVGACDAGELILSSTLESDFGQLFILDLLGEDRLFLGDTIFPLEVRFSEIENCFQDNIECDRVVEVRRAVHAAGLDVTPRGFTWHYHKGERNHLLLVPSDIHRKTYLG